MAGPRTLEPLKVLALSSQFPNPWEPHLAPFNRRQLRALASLCSLRLVSPVPFFHALRRRSPTGEGAEPFAVARPWFWYLPGVMRAWQGRWCLASCWPALKRAADELAPHLVYATWLYPDAWAGLMAARRLGLPLAVKIHGSDLNLFARDPRRLPFITEVLAQARAVAAPSRPLLAAAKELGVHERRAFLVPNGVEGEIFFPADKEEARRELGLPAQGPRLLFVGGLRPVKGPELALMALARLPGANMTVVGAGQMRPGLQRLAGQLGLGGRLLWAGELPAPKVARHMAACDALVLSSRHEGEPNVVLEALACGRPVAAFAVGGVPDLVAEGRQGCLAVPEDVPSLARAMAGVLGRAWDPQTLAASVGGRSWPASAQSLLQALNMAAGRAA